MLTVSVSDKGQIVIPVDIRKKLRLEKGTRLVVEEKEGKIVLRPLSAHPLLELRGIVKDVGRETLTETLLKERAKDRKKEER